MLIKEKIINKNIKLIKMKNDKNLSIDVINLGGRIVKLLWEDQNFKRDLTIQYEDIKSYENDDLYVNTLVGRTAGRINPTNFSFNNEEIKLSQNEGITNLLGGKNGLHTKYFDTQIEKGDNFVKLILKTKLKDCEDGFPGELDVKVEYILNNANEFKIVYFAKGNKDTLCNLTNHIYLNLNGTRNGEFTNHVFYNNSSYYYDVDDMILPKWNNKIIPKPFFNYTKKGWREKYLFDNPFVLKKEGEIKIVGLLSNIEVNISTTYPSYVLYTHNYPGNNKLKKYPLNAINTSFVIETQFLPNEIHSGKKEIFSILKKGKIYNEETLFRFKKINSNLNTVI